MNCNQVFMILTRGPFPTGEPWDEEVEAHLESCGDCWQLAEALRPALEVFQEAVPPAESRDLPGYWGDARPAGAVLAELTRAQGRTSVATHVRSAARPRANYQRDPFVGTLAIEVVRAVVFTSLITTAVICLALFWRG